MKKTGCTRKDVAELAGVSETVVSYVINNNRYVAEDKRKRVLAAVQQLKYRPNSIARALKGKGTNHLLFIADNIATEHFGVLVEEMDNIAYQQGYLISLLANRNTSDFVSQVISRHPDGIIISSVSLEEKYLQQLVDSNIPIVLLDNRIYKDLDSRVGVISPGIGQGIKDSVNLLIKQNRKYIYYIDRISTRGNFSTMDDLRLRGFVDIMSQSKLDFSFQHIFTGFTSEEQLSTAISKHIREGRIIDGIVARNDHLACVALNTLTELNIKVPKEIAVVGYDNAKISKIITPKLTTIELDRKGMAAGIIKMMSQMIEGDPPTTTEYKTKLILREST